jgi:transposase
MHRKTKLTPEVQERLCSAVRAGNYLQAACAYAGISVQTLSTWVKRGRERRQPYLDFLETLQKAKADAEVAVVALWRQQIPDNWQAARAFLERRFPDRWGRKDTHKVNVTATASVKVEHEAAELRKLPPDELLRLHREGLGLNGEAGKEP